VLLEFSLKLAIRLTLTRSFLSLMDAMQHQLKAGFSKVDIAAVADLKE
jgi:hypothetical protein